MDIIKVYQGMYKKRFSVRKGSGIWQILIFQGIVLWCYKEWLEYKSFCVFKQFSSSVWCLVIISLKSSIIFVWFGVWGSTKDGLQRIRLMAQDQENQGSRLNRLKLLQYKTWVILNNSDML